MFRAYRAGEIGREEYLAGLEAQADELEGRLGDARNVRLLASRYPQDFDRSADEILDRLMEEGFLNRRPDAAAADAFRRRVRAQFDHDGYRTYIQPSEARLACLISLAKRPRHVVVLGSYYGYWAIWTLPGAAAAGGDAVLVDPNPRVCALAERNLRALGFADRARVLCAKAEDVMDRLPDEIDLALLDADGGRDHPDSSYHGKGIYALLAERVFPRLAAGGLLLVHNDYRIGVGDNRLARPYVERMAEVLERFHRFCDGRFRRGAVFDTPDGFGAYMK